MFVQSQYTTFYTNAFESLFQNDDLKAVGHQGYLRLVGKLNRTTLSALPIFPSHKACLYAANVAAPCGHIENPSDSYCPTTVSNSIDF
jgi:hypothetical protein